LNNMSVVDVTIQYIGATGVVQRVQANGTAIVLYKCLGKKKWVINEDALQKQVCSCTGGVINTGTGDLTKLTGFSNFICILYVTVSIM